ncbi:MAG TPA: hypothetical protein P5120_16410 [Spirochaetota bacterium]|nr:hypothetical protein [Spirochaetota bacterium]HPF07380.1 hypothetical protein [Spirochaetota bacterium]HPJ43839.1 hypothetical protein [Spirochaetota bacterium]HPR38986.1 hypothetical protein [Spirochaetota bacterium]HRX49104.1 hypothetical protein [Spirochaetota bacterium]
MSIVRAIDQMIDELKEKNTSPEHIIMGKNYFYKWMVEISHDHTIDLEPQKKKYKFTHKNIPIIICESEILEIVPNAKFMLEDMDS